MHSTTMVMCKDLARKAFCCGTTLHLLPLREKPLTLLGNLLNGVFEDGHGLLDLLLGDDECWDESDDLIKQAEASQIAKTRW